ncbi:MAG: PrsW family intrarane metalloprotease [Nocardioidaceae bacterium]|nr:PrsW family intrarane metalloprotease [Nocardioidaceae bacterium]
MSTSVPLVLPAKLPVHKDKPQQRGRTLLKIVIAVTAVVGVIGAVAISASAGNAAGAGLSFLFAFIPLPFLWAAYWWLDRYEPEPLRYKLGAFVWGGVVAVALALTAQILIQHIFDLSDEHMATWIAPITEEPAKCALLLLTFSRMRHVIDGVIDGLVYAGIVGIGFAFVENIGYYAASYLGTPDIKIAGAEGATATFVVRGIFSPFAHPLFTSAFGIALGLAVARKTKWSKLAIGALGLAVSIALHGSWNGSLSYGGTTGFLLIYLGLGAVFFGLAITAIVVRAHQVRTLEQSLGRAAQRGWIHPDEVPYLSRFNHRKAARVYARQHHGKRAAKVVKSYQRLATEMAFLQDAVLTGRHKPHGVERTYNLLDSMHALRPFLRFPPPLSHHRAR